MRRWPLRFAIAFSLVLALMLAIPVGASAAATYCWKRALVVPCNSAGSWSTISASNGTWSFYDSIDFLTNLHTATTHFHWANAPLGYGATTGAASNGTADLSDALETRFQFKAETRGMATGAPFPDGYVNLRADDVDLVTVNGSAYATNGEKRTTLFNGSPHVQVGFFIDPLCSSGDFWAYGAVIVDKYVMEKPTSLTIALPTTCPYGGPATGTAVLRTNGVPVAGTDVEIWASFDNASWAKQATVRTDANGAIVFTPQPTRMTYFKVLHQGVSPTTGLGDGYAYAVSPVVCITPTSPTGVIDPSFEAWVPGSALGTFRLSKWSAGFTSQGSLTRASGSDWHRTGSYAAALSNPTSDPNQTSGLYQYDAPVVAGRAYTLSAYAVTDRNPSAVRLELQFMDAQRNALSRPFVTGDQFGLGGGAWSRLSLTSVAPAGAVSAHLVLNLRGGSYMGPGGGYTNGRVVWDDVSFGEAEAPTSITIKTSATTARIGSIPLLSGAVTPFSTVGKVMVVYVMKPGKTYWTYSSNRTVYVFRGSAAWLYKYYFKPGMTKGYYKFKAVLPAYPGFKTSTSPTTVSIRLQ